MKQSIKLGIVLLHLLFLNTSISRAAETDSVDVYQNHTVTGFVCVQGRNEITVQNVTVTNTGHLKISAPAGIVVTAPFTVNLGGILELNGGMQNAIRYTYDASGNRIKREKRLPL